MKSINGFWYFAHPYNCKTTDGRSVPEGEQANFEVCNMRAGELFLRGYNIYSPISHTHPIHRATPTFLSAEEHEMWYELDFEFMDRCNFDGIILAPGWEASSGCRGELVWMRKAGKRVLLYDDIIAGSTIQGETLAEMVIQSHNKNIEREKQDGRDDNNGAKEVREGGDKG